MQILKSSRHTGRGRRTHFRSVMNGAPRLTIVNVNVSCLPAIHVDCLGGRDFITFFCVGSSWDRTCLGAEGDTEKYNIETQIKLPAILKSPEISQYTTPTDRNPFKGKLYAPAACTRTRARHTRANHLEAQRGHVASYNFAHVG